MTHVYFIKKKYFSYPILGKLEDRLLLKDNNNRKIYPKFQSYRNDIVFENIVNGFYYKGGVKQLGPILKGFESKINPSELEYKLNNGIKINFSTEELIIKNKKLISPNSSVKVSYGNVENFLLHNSISLSYSIKDNILNIISRNIKSKK